VAYAQRDIAMIQERLRQRGEIGGISAAFVGQQGNINIEWERIKTEIVKGFGQDVIDFKEAILSFLKLTDLLLQGVVWVKEHSGMGMAQKVMAKLPPEVQEFLKTIGQFGLLGMLIGKIEKNTRKNEPTQAMLNDPSGVKWMNDLLGDSDNWGGGHALASIPHHVQPALSGGKWG
jgi:hypothetical protein